MNFKMTQTENQDLHKKNFLNFFQKNFWVRLHDKDQQIKLRKSKIKSG